MKKSAFSYIEIIIGVTIFIIILIGSMNVFMVLSNDLSREQNRLVHEIKFNEMCRFLKDEIRNKSEKYIVQSNRIETKRIEIDNSNVSVLQILKTSTTISVKYKSNAGGVISTNVLMRKVKNCTIKKIDENIYFKVEDLNGDIYEDVL